MVKYATLAVRCKLETKRRHQIQVETWWKKLSSAESYDTSSLRFPRLRFQCLVYLWNLIHMQCASAWILPQEYIGEYLMQVCYKVTGKCWRSGSPSVQWKPRGDIDDSCDLKRPSRRTDSRGDNGGGYRWQRSVRGSNKGTQTSQGEM